jgi:hypothetical protein
MTQILTQVLALNGLALIAQTSTIPAFKVISVGIDRA